ncbi:MAG: hypothetical protein ACHP7D_09245 [Lysobacterales bacterium]
MSGLKNRSAQGRASAHALVATNVARLCRDRLWQTAAGCPVVQINIITSVIGFIRRI